MPKVEEVEYTGDTYGYPDYLDDCEGCPYLVEGRCCCPPGVSCPDAELEDILNGQ